MKLSNSQQMPHVLAHLIAAHLVYNLHDSNPYKAQSVSSSTHRWETAKEKVFVSNPLVLIIVQHILGSSGKTSFLGLILYYVSHRVSHTSVWLTMTSSTLTSHVTGSDRWSSRKWPRERLEVTPRVTGSDQTSLQGVTSIQCCTHSIKCHNNAPCNNIRAIYTWTLNALSVTE